MSRSPAINKYDALFVFTSRRIRKDGLIKLLMALYPEYEWQPWKFQRGIAMTTTQIKENRIIFFDWASKKLGLKEMDDWYHVKPEQLEHISEGVEFLRKLLRGSLSKALMEAYPHHTWLEWRFATVPKSFWSDRENTQRFFEWLQRDILKLKSMSDWYNVSYNDVADHGGIRLLQIHKFSLPAALREAFPTHTFDEWRFQRWNNTENISKQDTQTQSESPKQQDETAT